MQTMAKRTGRRTEHNETKHFGRIGFGKYMQFELFGPAERINEIQSFAVLPNRMRHIEYCNPDYVINNTTLILE